eukprot:685721-Pleurochrysis_carterae.AAC.1
MARGTSRDKQRSLAQEKEVERESERRSSDEEEENSSSAWKQYGRKISGGSEEGTREGNYTDAAACWQASETAKDGEGERKVAGKGRRGATANDHTKGT